MTEPLTTALIADDEALLARDLAHRLQALWPGLRIVGLSHDGIDAHDMLQATRPDVAFLDIHMPGMSGLEVAAQIDFPCRVVFVTAHDEYALRAFEQAAVDYLLKPVEDARLARTVDRLRRLGREGTPAAPEDESTERPHGDYRSAQPPSGSPLRWIRAASGDEVQLVEVDRVIYFQALDKYVIVVTAEGQLLIRTRIRELVEQLDPAVFTQIHRGTIVNLRHVGSARQDEQGHLSLSLRQRPERLAVSRAWAGQFRQM